MATKSFDWRGDVSLYSRTADCGLSIPIENRVFQDYSFGHGRNSNLNVRKLLSTPYRKSYQLACVDAFRELGSFAISPATRLHYTAKAGNLATCFLGFSIHTGETYYRKSAELGLLASIFDLTSDGLDFAPSAIEKFRRLSRAILDKNAADILLTLMDQKRMGCLEQNGLDRGIGALRVIVKHLLADSNWRNEGQIIDSGILFQVVDDVLDYARDIKTDHLNFLKHDSSNDYLQALLRWDFEGQFRTSQNTLVLFGAIRRAKALAHKIAFRRGDVTHSPS